MPRTRFVTFLGCLASVALVACDGNNSLMQPGQNCLACHSSSGGEKVFTAAGTVYASPTADTNDGVDGVEVVLTDANNKKVSLTSNAAGNFYTSEPLAFPIHAELRRNGNTVAAMSSPIENGGCASCHTVPSVGGAPGRIYAP